MAWIDNLLWDAAIEADPRIAIGIGFRDPDDETGEGREVLYRPGELVVDRNVWGDEGHPLRQELDRNGAVPIGQRPRSTRDRDRSAAADELDLELVYIRDRDPLGLLRDAREAELPEAEAATLNHVIAGSPQRHGGDSPPMAVSAEDEIEIPAVGAEGQNVTVGVLDTGIVEPGPFPADVRGPEDQEIVATFPPGPYGVAVGHGTLVAGVVAQYAPGAELVVRRVLHTPGGVADETEVAAALRDFPTVDVLNASFSGFAVSTADSMRTFRRAVERIQAGGTLLVAAVGNQQSEQPAYMAAFQDVIGVASVEGDPAALQLATYSNRGNYVKLCAHGTDVQSTYVTGQAMVSGTSFAAPKVAAAIATIMARDGNGSGAAVQKLLGGQTKVAKAGTFVDPENLPA